LGDRSILAPAHLIDVKNKLNLQVKKREWFQPFCPSLLEEDAPKIFEDYENKPDRMMTMGFMARPEIRERVQSVIHVDGSSRPQMVGNENPNYRKLIETVRNNTQIGIILNTSFNLHGFPIVCTPADAIKTMLDTNTRYMIMGNYFVELKQ
jgi:carbamoyltransferase